MKLDDDASESDANERMAFFERRAASMPALRRRSNGEKRACERERPCRERCGEYARVE